MIHMPFPLEFHNLKKTRYRPTDRRTDGRTDPHIEMRGRTHLKTGRRVSGDELNECLRVGMSVSGCVSQMVCLQVSMSPSSGFGESYHNCQGHSYCRIDCRNWRLGARRDDRFLQQGRFRFLPKENYSTGCRKTDSGQSPVRGSEQPNE